MSRAAREGPYSGSYRLPSKGAPALRLIFALVTAIVVLLATVSSTVHAPGVPGEEASKGTSSVDQPTDLSSFPYHLSPAGSSGPPADARDSPLFNKVIVIDPGHGGDDPGAPGRHGESEKDLTLDIGRKLQALLEEAAARPLLLRSGDQEVSLYERPALANQVGADASVSIHLNWYQSRWVHGLEVYYYHTHPASVRLAAAIDGQLLSQLGLTDRGITDEQTYVAVREVTSPSVLIEVGYLSHPTEEKLLHTEAFRQKVAVAIRDGLSQFFSGK